MQDNTFTPSTFIVGLTGGIGSGKTTVSDHLATKGITIVDADQISRDVVKKGASCLAEIHKHFGDSILLDTGELNRAQLRSIIFENEQEKAWLNALLHPAIRVALLDALNASTSTYTLLSAPLLLENQLDKLCHKVLVVDVTEEIQLERTMRRDSNSAEQVKRIINAQIDRASRLKKADDIVTNNTSKPELLAQVDKLHPIYLSLGEAFNRAPPCT